MEEAGRVLVIDDDPANRRFIQLQLEEAGFHVETGTSGQECLDMARRVAPDCILLDIQMPVMDGIETCRQLKANLDTAGIPVLFITGHRDDEPTAVAALSAGGNDFISKDATTPVLLARVRSQVAICRYQAKLRQMAMTDELTGLFSRRFLFDSLRRAVKASTRRGPQGLACLLADVDHFKQINDKNGHIAGDKVLRQIADTIRRNTRENDLVARFGGEEFVIMATDVDEVGAMTFAEKLRSAVQRETPATLSIGVARLGKAAAVVREPDMVDRIIQALIHRADEAMYAAKDAGRNCVVLSEHVLTPEEALRNA